MSLSFLQQWFTPHAGIGYWEPHSSSVDFCEPNYYLSPYIAEFHNSWSSLVIALLGIFGIFFGNATGELRFTVMHLTLCIIGIGSFFLHSTLHWIPQSSDEVPMLYQNLAFLYGLIEMKSPFGQSKYPWLASTLFILAIIQTFIYYTFQSFYIAFLIAFIGSISIVILWTAYYAYEPSATSSQLKERWIVWFLIVFSFVGVGSTLWIIEMTYCQHLLPYFKSTGFGATFHVIWHLSAGFSGYLGPVYLGLIRLQALNVKSRRLYWVAGCIPIWVKNNKEQ